MKKIESLKATNNYVVLKAVTIKEQAPQEKKLDSGLILPASLAEREQKGTRVSVSNGDKIIVDHFEVLDIGPDVDKDKIGFKIGDSVLADNYDTQPIGDDENTYIVCKASSIKCIFKFKE